MKKSLLLFLLLININTAQLEQLDELAGIGPKYAQSIIDARPFSSVDDLLKVKGIGEKTLQKIKEQGLACVDCEQEEVRPPENLHADSVEVGPPKGYPGGIFINEILPSPEGADETEEWIEIYNSNDDGFDLFGWTLEDAAGTKTSFLINRKILAHEYLVFKRPETKIMLNNNGDSVNLLTPDNKIEDSMAFENAPIGQSYNKTASGWQWSKTLTPGAINKIALPNLQNSQNILSNPKKSDNNNLVAGLSGAIETTSEKNSNPWVLFFIALAITLFSAIFVLVIKLKFSKNHVRT